VSEVFDRDRIHRKLTEMSAFWRQRIDGWRDEGTESGTEKRHAQQLWSHLMQCFDIASERIDVFERNADRASTGGRGYIDFFWSGVVIGEAKSLNVPLDRAYEQVLDYLNGGSVGTHEWPRFILVTNFESFRLARLGHPEESWTVEFSIDEIADHLEQLLFFAGVESLTKREQEEASIVAAGIMADLFNVLVGEDVDEAVGEDAPTSPEDEDEDLEMASILMTRLLFLMYGDDAGLWEQDLFYRWLESVNSKNLGPALDGLFELLNADGNTRRRRYRNLGDLEARFPYVNGGIFDGTGKVGYSVAPEFKDALMKATRFRWTQISPAIFGSMFQLVKSKEARRGDGEHYTSEANILKTIQPLFLEEYRSRADRLIANKSTSAADLRRFQEELAANIYIDPACGAGNFLNVAYAKLREIETDIIVERRKRSGTTTGVLDVTMLQMLTIDKFYGFEINWWPAKIAETAMFLVDHQANRELAARVGEAPERLPITITAHILHGNALDFEWTEVLPKTAKKTYIFGNPPFVGQKEKSPSQIADMKRVWGDQYDGYFDYVTGWHAQSLRYFGTGREGAFAFVATNSITQGQPVASLFAPIFDAGWRIRFAHRTFSWDSEAPGKAAVHCVIVGFDRESEPRPKLWDYPNVGGKPVNVPVEGSINAYLVDGPRVLISKRMKPLAPNLSKIRSGSKAVDWGYYTFDDERELKEIQNDPVASKFIRVYLGGDEVINRTPRWCLWLVDATRDDLKQSPILRARVEQVAKRRLASKRPATLRAGRTPLLFGEMRQPTGRYLAIPQTFSEHRNYFTADWLEADVIASIKLFTVEDNDGLLFAIISSSMFMTWQKTIGGRMKSDPSFSNTIVWNNFPVPELEERTRDRVIAAGKKVLAARELQPERTLADHYEPQAMAPELLKAHDALDREVDKAFGATRKLTNERQREKLLFQNYEALASQEAR